MRSVQQQPWSGVHWYGNWPEEVLFSFLALTSEQAIKDTEARTAGAPGESANPEKARLARIADLLARVHAHNGFRRLKQLPGFQRIKADRTRLARGNALFADPFGEVRLVREIAMIVGAHNPNWRPKRATLAQQRKVLTLTRKLRGALTPGTESDDILEMGRLPSLLKKLDDKLDRSVRTAERTGQRPTRADRDAAQRYWIIGFCKHLIEYFGEAPPIIVREVSAMIGYTPDEATVARYIKRAVDERNRMSPGADI